MNFQSEIIYFEKIHKMNFYFAMLTSCRKYLFYFEHLKQLNGAFLTEVQSEPLKQLKMIRIWIILVILFIFFDVIVNMFNCI